MAWGSCLGLVEVFLQLKNVIFDPAPASNVQLCVCPLRDRKTTLSLILFWGPR